MRYVGNFYQVNRAARLPMYSALLSQLRSVLINKMAKPEGVLMAEIESPEARLAHANSPPVLLYRNMRDCLMYLAASDFQATQMQIFGKLSRLGDGQDWSLANLNTTCWAIGALSNAMNEDQEQLFINQVIPELFKLEQMRATDTESKISMGSSIMYVLGQYPRFLIRNWPELQKVMELFFNFMKHDGTQDVVRYSLLPVIFIPVSDGLFWFLTMRVCMPRRVHPF